MDSTKLATAAGVEAFATLDDVDQVFVDELAPREHIDQLLAAGVPVAVCGDGRAALLRGGTGRKRKRIGFANLTEDHPFPFAVRLGLERAASAVRDVDLLVADNAMNGPTALKHVDYFVNHGADIVIEYQYHADYGAVIMADFRTADIPVIAVDVPLPGATYFGVDNYVAGQIGGNAAADTAIERWGGSVDRVVSLDLGAAGRTPAARMQGQLDALRGRITVSDDQIVHIDAGISRSDTQIAVADMLHAFPDQARVVYLAGTDEVALGAIDAIKQADMSELSVVVSQGADAGARAEILTPGSPLVGAVSYVPERYGPQLLQLALAILDRQPDAASGLHLTRTGDRGIDSLWRTRLACAGGYDGGARPPGWGELQGDCGADVVRASSRKEGCLRTCDVDALTTEGLALKPVWRRPARPPPRPNGRGWSLNGRRFMTIARKFTSLGIATALVVGGASAALAQDSAAPIEIPPPGPELCGDGQWEVGFANLVRDITFTIDVEESIQRAADATGCVNLSIFDNELDGATALANADNMITLGSQGVIEFQTDEKFGLVIMDKFRAENIPVIAIDIPLPGATFFGADNYRAGFMAGEGMSQAFQERFPDSDPLVFLGELPQSGPVPAARMTGILEGVRSVYPDLDDETQVVRFDSKNTLEESRTQMSNLIQTVPEGTKFMGAAINDGSTIGMQAAIADRRPR